MARHRRMLAPINSIKHFIARPRADTTAASVTNLVVAEAAAAPASAATIEVLEGSIIKAVWIELWILTAGASGSSAQVTITLEKISSNGTPPTFTQMLNLQAYPNKKNILFTHQGVQETTLDGSNSVPIMRQWFLIPKGKQRMGLGDSINLNIAAVAENLTSCGMFIYKEYR